MDPVKNVYLVAVGGISRIVVDMVRNHLPGYRIAGYFDDDKAKLGKTYDGIEVLGTFRDSLQVDRGELVFNCVGNIKHMQSRIDFFNVLREQGFSFASFVHPAAVVSPTAVIGEGTLVCPNVVISVNTRIGMNAIVFSGSIIEHDAEIGDSCYLSPAVVINGKVRVEDNCYIGPGALIAAGMKLGRNSIIGAGAVVLDDVPAGVLVAGCPAKYVRNNESWV